MPIDVIRDKDGDLQDIEDEKLIDPLDKLLSTEVQGGPPPIGPDGMPFVISEPFRIPDATPENMVCLRGPCRHYFEPRLVASVGNTADSLDEEPLAINRVCMRVPGFFYDLMDECVRSCTGWDPVTATEIRELESRRENFYERFPQFKGKGAGNGSR